MSPLCILFALLLTAISCAAGAADERPLTPLGPYRLHEWGTFTCLVDEAGAQLGGINTDDEPVPEFVHLLRATALNAHGFPSAPIVSKAPVRGGGACDPRVTMRLETPVIYFYPQQTTPGRVSVSVKLTGGVLGEYYPAAFPALVRGSVEPARDWPVSQWESTLSWPALMVNAVGQPRETSDRAWLAPRQVPDAAMVDIFTPGGIETEKYLFYRGVGDFAPELRVRREGDRLVFPPEMFSRRPDATPLPFVTTGWVVNVPRQGELTWAPLDLAGTPAVPSTARGLATLKTAMHAGLVKEGLTPPEATAMLETWQHGYFETPGTKVFYLATRAWVDARLPLTATPAPTETVRVMLGRIEMVTPEQRVLLKEIATQPVPDREKVTKLIYSEERLRQPGWFFEAMDGRADIAALGRKLPPAYLAYVKLGRFRQALVLDELKQRPTPQLEKFVATFLSVQR